MDALLTFLTVFIPLLIVIDPFASIPIFYSLTQKFDSAQRMKVSLQATSVAVIILIIAALFGEWLIIFLGISIGSFRIAGGLLLLYIAFEMFLGPEVQTKSVEPEDVGAVPIGTPLLAGPGAITAVILLENSVPSGLGLLYVTVSIVVIAILAFLSLSYCDFLYKILGKNGARIFARIMGLVLAAMAIDFVKLGLIQWGVIA